MEKKQVKPTPSKKDARKKPPQVKAPMPMRGFAMWFLMMALVFAVLQMINKPAEQERLDYNPGFMELVKSGRIIRCEIVRDTSGADYITGELTEIDIESGEPKTFRVDVVVTEKLLTDLQAADVTFKVKPSSSFWPIFWNVAPFLIGFIVIYFLVDRKSVV